MVVICRYKPFSRKRLKNNQIVVSIAHVRRLNSAFVCSIMAVISRFELLFSFKLDSYEHILWIEPLNYIRIVIILAKNAVLFIKKS